MTNAIRNINQGSAIKALPYLTFFFVLFTLYFKVLLITYKINNHGNKKQNQTLF